MLVFKSGYMKAFGAACTQCSEKYGNKASRTESCIKYISICGKFITLYGSVCRKGSVNEKVGVLCTCYEYFNNSDRRS